MVEVVLVQWLTAIQTSATLISSFSASELYSGSWLAASPDDATHDESSPWTKHQCTLMGHGKGNKINS